MIFFHSIQMPMVRIATTHFQLPPWQCFVHVSVLKCESPAVFGKEWKSCGCMQRNRVQFSSLALSIVSCRFNQNNNVEKDCTTNCAHRLPKKFFENDNTPQMKRMYIHKKTGDILWRFHLSLATSTINSNHEQIKTFCQPRKKLSINFYPSDDHV